MCLSFNITQDKGQVYTTGNNMWAQCGVSPKVTRLRERAALGSEVLCYCPNIPLQTDSAHFSPCVVRVWAGYYYSFILVKHSD